MGASESPYSLDDLITLTAHAKDAMLDLILAFGTLDGAISMLASTVFGLDPTSGSILFSRSRAEEKIAKMIRLHTAHGVIETASELKMMKKAYQRHVASRNTVAHSHCIGVSRTDNEIILFATYETEAHGTLAIDQIHLQTMQNDAAWARRTAEMCLEQSQETFDKRG